MPVSINDRTYYMIAEACVMARTNRNTLLRWIREGRYSDVKTRIETAGDYSAKKILRV